MAGIINVGDRVFLNTTDPVLTESREVSTTKFVQQQMVGKAQVHSPTFTGNARATTPPTLDISTKAATTEYVKNVLAGVFQPITAPVISIPSTVQSGSKNNRLIISGSKSQRSPIVRYTIEPVTGFQLNFHKTTDIIDGQIILFDALIATRDTVVLFNVIPTDGILIGNPLQLQVLVKAV